MIHINFEASHFILSASGMLRQVLDSASSSPRIRPRETTVYSMSNTIPLQNHHNAEVRTTRWIPKRVLDGNFGDAVSKSVRGCHSYSIRQIPVDRIRVMPEVFEVRVVWLRRWDAGRGGFC